MHLVLGSTGKTGRRVVERLTSLGQAVRGGSRRGTPPFDWNDPAGWPAVLDGVQRVYVTYQPDLAVPGAKENLAAFTAAAEKAGVERLVLLSGKGETEAERCEAIVMSSSIDSTVVRASWFNQNFSEYFFRDPILAGHLALPRAEAKIPFVDADDIADVVVACLTGDDHTGQTYELTGPRTLTFADATREIAEILGRPIEFTPVSLDDYEAMLREYGVPGDVVWLIRYLFTEVLTPENSVVTDDVQRVLGRPATDFSDFARAAASAGAWATEAEPAVA